MKKLTMMLCLWAGAMCAQAQIGYQISLLNTATGEPRANETVTVTVSLSNSAGEVFYSETKSATTNDFGVLSLSVGNADTFKEVDLTKMPFYIEASANGVMIGKSQILSVPVAEVAKRLAPFDVVGKWQSTDSDREYITFFNDGTGTYYHWGANESFSYTVDGNIVFLKIDRRTKVYLYFNGSIIEVNAHNYTFIK